MPMSVRPQIRSRALFVMSACFLPSPKPCSRPEPRLRGGFGRRRHLLLTLGALATLAACGKKGPLELPPPDAETVDEQPGGDAE